MGPLVTEGRQCHPSLGDALLRSNSGSNYPTRQADVLRDWAQQHRPRRRHSHGPWCSARDGSNAAVLERNMTAQAPTRLAQTPQEGPTRQGSDAAARKHARQQLLVLAPKPRAWSPAPRAPKRSLALEGSTALTSLMLARALGTTVEQLEAPALCLQRVAYQGAPGAHGESAALQAVPNGDPMPCEQFEVAFQALSQWLADCAVLPIESSVGGSIHAVYDLLLKCALPPSSAPDVRQRRYRVHIVGEVSIEARQSPAALRKAVNQDLERLMGHTSAPIDRRASLSNNISPLTGAASGGPSLKSARGRDSYSPSMLYSGVQDASANTTRFLVLSREPTVCSQDDPRPHKTSLAFALPEGPKRLYEALSVFALRNLDICKIESRPMRSDPLASAIAPGAGQCFRYLIYVDIVGSLADPAMQNALRHLQEATVFMRVLGCYPRKVNPSLVQARGESGLRSLLNSSSILANALPVTVSPPAPPPQATEHALLPSRNAYTPVQAITVPHTSTAVAYQGAPGAYSEGAALHAVPGSELLPCEQFETAFEALSHGHAGRAVLPIENSLGGSIHAVYDLLIRYRLHIVGEVTVPVRHCLLALPGVKRGDLRRVTSHYQALAQCDGYIRRMPGVSRDAFPDTAGAAKMIAEMGLRDTAAIASARAGELYGLVPLDTNIQDNAGNMTRFLVLSRNPLAVEKSDTRAFKTSVVFAFKEGPGQLIKALSVFALRDLPLYKVESRPMHMQPGSSGDSTFENLFHIDFAGSVADENVQHALRHLAELAPFVRTLGCFPCEIGV